jgi:transposase InsO family protein
MTWKPRNFLALLVASMGCWLEQQAAAQIEYLRAENRLLRSRLGRRRLLFTDTERRALATHAKEIEIKALRDLDPLVSAATLLRWHRHLVAQKWTFLERRCPGRPRTTIDTEQLVVPIAHENPGWGYTRIQGALLNLDIKIGRGTQAARTLTDSESGMLLGKRHLIVDRNTKYSAAFRTFLSREGVEVIRLPPRSPNLNAFAERFVRSVKSECLSKLVPIGARMLRRAPREYMEHDHGERNNQGLDNQLIAPARVRRSRPALTIQGHRSPVSPRRDAELLPTSRRVSMSEFLNNTGESHATDWLAWSQAYVGGAKYP